MLPFSGLSTAACQVNRSALSALPTIHRPSSGSSVIKLTTDTRQLLQAPPSPHRRFRHRPLSSPAPPQRHQASAQALSTRRPPGPTAPAAAAIPNNGPPHLPPRPPSSRPGALTAAAQALAAAPRLPAIRLRSSSSSSSGPTSSAWLVLVTTSLTSQQYQHYSNTGPGSGLPNRPIIALPLSPG